MILGLVECDRNGLEVSVSEKIGGKRAARVEVPMIDGEDVGWEVGRLRTKPRRPEEVQGGKSDACEKKPWPREGAGCKVEHVHSRRPQKVGWEVRL